MTGPSGIRVSICPLRFRIASSKIPIDLSCASINRNPWEGHPESLGANKSAYYPRETNNDCSHYLFNSNLTVDLILNLDYG